MKSSLMAVGALTAAVLSVTPAAAQDGPLSGASFYGTLGYSHQSDGPEVGAVTGRLGARFNPYVAVEGELGFGVKDDDIYGANFELNHHAAAYVVGLYPVTPQFDLFARVGYGTQEFGAEGILDDYSFSEESWNYGVGAQYFFDGRNGVRGDYTRHDYDHGENDVWSIAYVRKF